MIRIKSDGTKLVVCADIPMHLNGGKDEHYALASELGGSPVAVAALAEALREKLTDTLKEIRRQAYQQGARDRANRAAYFSGSFKGDERNGGCW